MGLAENERFWSERECITFATCLAMLLPPGRPFYPSTVQTALFMWLINFVVLWSVPQHGQKLRQRVFTDEQRLSARLPSVVC